MQLNKILVPTDLSSGAQKGLEVAIEIAKRTGAGICMVYFPDMDPSRLLFREVEREKDKPQYLVQLNTATLKKSQSKLALLASHYSQSGVPIEYRIVSQTSHNGVFKRIKKEDYDLVVMGVNKN